MSKYKLPDPRYITPFELMSTITAWHLWLKYSDSELWRVVCPMLAWVSSRVLSIVMDRARIWWEGDSPIKEPEPESFSPFVYYLCQHCGRPHHKDGSDGSCYPMSETDKERIKSKIAQKINIAHRITHPTK